VVWGFVADVEGDMMMVVEDGDYYNPLIIK
jgi:hypothetical protein